MKRSLTLIAAAALIGVALTGCSSGGSEAPAETTPAANGSSLDALIEAAQQEGEVVFYLTPPEATAQALADAFYDAYEIEASFVRLTGGELASRYSAEVESGSPAADLVMPSYDEFIDRGLEEGWLTGFDEADIPDYADFPESGKINDGQIPVVQFAPSVLSWNTEALGDRPMPETFEDLADSQYSNSVLLSDPTSSQAYLQFWTLIMDEYGIETVKAIADNQVRLYNSVVPMTESLAAGEGAVTGPNVAQVVTGAQKNGAPVDFLLPDVTTGPEIVMSLTTNAAHPNAARLFAHFVLSEEGQSIINNAPATFSARTAYDLPSGYVRVDRDQALANKDAILQAFGL